MNPPTAKIYKLGLVKNNSQKYKIYEKSGAVVLLELRNVESVVSWLPIKVINQMKILSEGFVFNDSFFKAIFFIDQEGDLSVSYI